MPVGDRGTPGEAGPGHGRTGIYLLAVGLVIMLAGLLFGYHQGVISGALTGIQKQFSVGTLLLEVITSWVTLGAMVGALVFVRWFVPETENRSLEELEELWGDPAAIRLAIGRPSRAD